MYKENKLYRLEEMVDNMKQSLNNVSKVINEQQYLVDALKSLNDEKFTMLITESEKQIDNLQKQQSILIERQQCLEELCNECRDNEEKTNILNKLLFSLGVFKDEE